MDGYRVCKNLQCNKLLPLDAFKKVKCSNGEYYLKTCKECIKKKDRELKKIKYHSDLKIKNKIINRSKKYYLDNKNLIKDKSSKLHKIYYQKNKKNISDRTKKYYQENKEWYKAYQKEYEKIHPRKNRAKSPASIMQKIRSSISRSISKQIRKNGSHKCDSIINYIDFSFNELKNHLESKFESWMHWDNYGIYNSKTWDDNDTSTWAWQIDHIIPHSHFPYTSVKDENFKKCWSLDNLRPYSAKQNILDGIRRIRHKENIK